MKHYKQEIEKTEMQIFADKFWVKGKKRKFRINGDASGKIISIETDDKEILAYAKELGLKQDG